MATYTVANLTDVLASTGWSFDGSNFFIGSAGVGIVIGGATGGDVANSVNVAGGFLINGVSIFTSPTFTGTPAAPTAAPGTNTTQIATTAFVVASFAPIASPTFTGTPAAPTPAVGDNTTKLATTAFVQSTISNPNKLINPFMEFDQVNEGAAYSPAAGASAHTIDGWNVLWSAGGTPAFAVQRIADAPTGYANSLKMTMTTAGTIAAGSVAVFLSPIEADDLIDTAIGTAGALPLSVTVWLKASIAATYSGAITNYAGTRSYPVNFIISSANTWQKFTVVVPGDTAGTWVTSGNAGSMYLTIAAAAGTTFQGTANTWATGQFFGTSSNTNSFLTTSGATFQLGPCKLEVGQAPTALVRESVSKELAKVRRYYSKSYDIGTAVGAASTVGEYIVFNAANANAVASITLQVPMRADPTVVGYSTVTGASGKWRDTINNTDVNFSTAGIGQNTFFVNCSASAGASSNITGHFTADARL